MAHDVFICHSSKDKKIADAICAKLEQNKIRCWIAPRDVVPGQDFAESIVAAIHASRVTVFVFSANSNASPHVSHELERSVSLGLPILPFRVDDVVPSPALEYFISSAHWLDALTPPMEQHIDRLVTTVATLLDREVEPPAPAAVRPRRSRRTWVAAGAGAVAVLAAVAVGLAVTLGGGPDKGTDGGTSGKPTTSATPSGKATPFVDEFTTAVGPGWSWTNEDKSTWRVTPQGWLEIDSQESPPMSNILLRDAPGTSYKVKVRLRFPATASGFAGLVLMGDDPDSRLEYGWTKHGLTTRQYKDGQSVDEGWMETKYAHVAADREIVLILSVDGGSFKVQYYDRKYDQFMDFGNMDDAETPFTRVGVTAYQTDAGPSATAAFDSIQFF
jgi:hypothetical protein